MNELVSVIIPTFNRANFIIDTIHSVLNQTYPSIEIIIIDDGSTDNTVKLVEDFRVANECHNQLKYFILENSGAPVARNFGFLKSSGAFIVFFDSDDLMLPDRIRTQVALMRREQTECCACGYYINSTENDSQVNSYIDTKPPLDNFIDRRLRGYTQMWIFTRLLIEKVKGFDPYLKCKQDQDLIFRILRLYPSVSISQLPLSIYNDHAGAERISRNSLKLVGVESIVRFNLKIVQHCYEKWMLINFLIALKHFAGDIKGLPHSSTLCLNKSNFHLKEGVREFSLTKRATILVGFNITYRIFTLKQLLGNIRWFRS